MHFIWSSGCTIKNTCQWWLVWSVFSLIFCSDDHTSHPWRDFCNWNPRRRFILFALRDARSRTHANDDWCGLYFPWFFPVTTIPHIVDVISVSDTLVVLLASGWGFKNTCQWWLVRSVFSCILCSDGHTSQRWCDFCYWNPRHFALWDELSRTHANDDWWGLYLPVFYAVVAIPHIVDVTSLSDILVVLLFGMSLREYMPMMTGAVCIFLYFMQWQTTPVIIGMCSQRLIRTTRMSDREVKSTMWGMAVTA